MIRIIIDADSCSRYARDILLRRVGGRKNDIALLFIANQASKLPTESRHMQQQQNADPATAAVDTIQGLVVSPDPEATDNAIIEHAEAGDLVITRDIPLASRLLELGIAVMNDYGHVFNAESIGERVSERGFSMYLRDAGLRRSSPHKDKNANFANSLDRFLTQAG